MAKKSENARWLLIGTSEIGAWTIAEPFVIPIESEQEFIDNGVDDYDECKQMKVGQIREDDDYEGVYIMRIK